MKKRLTLFTFLLLFLLSLIPTDESIAQTQKGQDIDGEAANDQSGVSVSLSSDGKTILENILGNITTVITTKSSNVYHSPSNSYHSHNLH